MIEVRLHVLITASNDQQADVAISKIMAVVGEFAPLDAPTINVFERDRSVVS